MRIAQKIERFVEEEKQCDRARARTLFNAAIARHALNANIGRGAAPRARSRRASHALAEQTARSCRRLFPGVLASSAVLYFLFATITVDASLEAVIEDFVCLVLRREREFPSRPR